MEQKIFAKARFVPQSKTLAEWEAENPVLLAGEHGVANDGAGIKREKIGDGVTRWNELDWWKGESAYDVAVRNGFDGTESEWLMTLKGEKGDTGARGIQGIQGIKGEKGDPGEVTNLDQTYSSTSENAQSGVAVAEAVGTCVPRPVRDGSGHHKLIAYSDAGDINEPIDDKAFFTIDIEGSGIYQNCIAKKDSKGNLQTNTPVNDLDCVNYAMFYALEHNFTVYKDDVAITYATKSDVNYLVGNIETLLGGI